MTHLYMLKPFWKDKNRFWVTFNKEDAKSLLEGEKVYPCYFPTNRSIKALIKNTKIAWNVLHKPFELLVQVILFGEIFYLLLLLVQHEPFKINDFLKRLIPSNRKLEEITRPMVVELIEKIEVYEGNRVEITFRFHDEIVDLLEELHQKAADTA